MAKSCIRRTLMGLSGQRRGNRIFTRDGAGHGSATDASPRPGSPPRSGACLRGAGGAVAPAPAAVAGAPVAATGAPSAAQCLGSGGAGSNWPRLGLWFAAFRGEALQPVTLHVLGVGEADR